MTHLDILSKNVMGENSHRVNAVGVGSTNHDDMEFDTLYSKEVNLLENKAGGYQWNSIKQGGNKGQVCKD